MIASEELAELNAALSAAQGQFKAVAKDADNPFFKSKYAPLPDVVAAATPILAEHGLAIWQGADVDDVGELFWTVVLHKSGQYLGSAARMKPVKNDPQAQGSAETYARRYGYMAALGLVADEDDDGNAASNSEPASRPKSRGKASARASAPKPSSKPQGASQSPPVNAETLAAIKGLYESSGMTPPQLAEILTSVGAGNTKMSDLPQDKAEWVLVALRERAGEPGEVAVK